MKKTFYIIFGLVSIILFLSVIQITLSNKLSTSGAVLSKLQDQIKSYEKENTLLQEKILTLSSLTNLASKSAELGFVPSKSQLVLGTSVSLALKQ